MSIRDTLVHLKFHEEWSRHIDYAIRSAKLFSCNVRALVTFHEVVILRNRPRYAGQGLEEQMEKDAAIARHLKSKFIDACAKAGVAGSFDTPEGGAGEFIPRHGQLTPSPEHVLVAWNGSAMAVAAVHGELPFLERARKVTICSGELRLPLRLVNWPAADSVDTYLS